jgi:predicted lactoylglutathione lyase
MVVLRKLGFDINCDKKFHFKRELVAIWFDNESQIVLQLKIFQIFTEKEIVDLCGML